MIQTPLIPVAIAELHSDIPKHILDTLSRLARGLVDARHEVVALLTESLHVRVRYLDLVLLVKLIAAPAAHSCYGTRCNEISGTDRNILAFSA